MDVSMHFLLSIHCMTFNHSNYIKETMDGFCMQQTNFPFVAIIVDDASTDGEQEVIKEYLKNHFDLTTQSSSVRERQTEDYIMTFARHKTNVNCFFAVFFLKYNHYSIKKAKDTYYKKLEENAKYIAICEGDDYWILPSKLQQQVDYLESDSECNLVYTNFVQLVQRNNTFTKVTCRTSDFEDMIEENRVATLTTCFRKESLLEYNNNRPLNKHWLMGDYPLWLYLFATGTPHFMNIETAVYRVLENSASHSTDFGKTVAFLLSSYEIRWYYAKVFDRKYLLHDSQIRAMREIINLSDVHDKNTKFDYFLFFRPHSISDFLLLIEALSTSYRITRKIYNFCKYRFSIVHKSLSFH